MNANGTSFCPIERGRKRDRVSPFCRITGKSHSMDEHHYTPSPDNYPRLEMQPCCRVTEKSTYFKDYHHVYPIIDQDGVIRVVTEHDFHCRITAKYRAMAGHKYIYPLLGATNNKTAKDMESIVENKIYGNVLIPIEVENMIRGGIKDVRKLNDSEYIFIHSKEGSLFPAALREIPPKRTKEYGKYSRRHTMPIALEAQISMKSKAQESLQLRMIKELKKPLKAPPEDFSLFKQSTELLKDVRKTRAKKPRRAKGKPPISKQENGVRRLATGNEKSVKRVRVEEDREIISNGNGELKDVAEEDGEVEVNPAPIPSRLENFKLNFQNFEISDTKTSKNMLMMIGAFDPNDVVELDFSEDTTETADGCMCVDVDCAATINSTVKNCEVISSLNSVSSNSMDCGENVDTINENAINVLERNSKRKIDETAIEEGQNRNIVGKSVDFINDGNAEHDIDQTNGKRVKSDADKNKSNFLEKEIDNINIESDIGGKIINNNSKKDDFFGKEFDNIKGVFVGKEISNINDIMEQVDNNNIKGDVVIKQVVRNNIKEGAVAKQINATNTTTGNIVRNEVDNNMEKYVAIKQIVSNNTNEGAIKQINANNTTDDIVRNEVDNNNTEKYVAIKQVVSNNMNEGVIKQIIANNTTNDNVRNEVDNIVRNEVDNIVRNEVDNIVRNEVDNNNIEKYVAIKQVVSNNTNEDVVIKQINVTNTTDDIVRNELDNDNTAKYVAIKEAVSNNINEGVIKQTIANNTTNDIVRNEVDNNNMEKFVAIKQVVSNNINEGVIKQISENNTTDNIVRNEVDNNNIEKYVAIKQVVSNNINEGVVIKQINATNTTDNIVRNEVENNNTEKHVAIKQVVNNNINEGVVIKQINATNTTDNIVRNEVENNNTEKYVTIKQVHKNNTKDDNIKNEVDNNSIKTSIVRYEVNENDNTRDVKCETIETNIKEGVSYKVYEDNIKGIRYDIDNNNVKTARCEVHKNDIEDVRYEINDNNIKEDVRYEVHENNIEEDVRCNLDSNNIKKGVISVSNTKDDIVRNEDDHRKSGIVTISIELNNDEFLCANNSDASSDISSLSEDKTSSLSLKLDSSSENMEAANDLVKNTFDITKIYSNGSEVSTSIQSDSPEFNRLPKDIQLSHAQVDALCLPEVKGNTSVEDNASIQNGQPTRAELVTEKRCERYETKNTSETTHLNGDKLSAEQNENMKEKIAGHIDDSQRKGPELLKIASNDATFIKGKQDKMDIMKYQENVSVQHSDIIALLSEQIEHKTSERKRDISNDFSNTMNACCVTKMESKDFLNNSCINDLCEKDKMKCGDTQNLERGAISSSKGKENSIFHVNQQLEKFKEFSKEELLESVENTLKKRNSAIPSDSLKNSVKERNGLLSENFESNFKELNGLRSENFENGFKEPDGLQSKNLESDFKEHNESKLGNNKESFKENDRMLQSNNLMDKLKEPTGPQFKIIDDDFQKSNRKTQSKNLIDDFKKNNDATDIFRKRFQEPDGIIKPPENITDSLDEEKVMKKRDEITHKQVDAAQKNSKSKKKQNEEPEQKIVEPNLISKKLKKWQSIEFDPDSFDTDDFVETEFENNTSNSNVCSATDGLPSAEESLQNDLVTTSKHLENCHESKTFATSVYSNIPECKGQVSNIPEINNDSKLENYESERRSSSGKIEKIKQLSKPYQASTEISNKIPDFVKPLANENKRLEAHASDATAKLSFSIEDQLSQTSESTCIPVKKLDDTVQMENAQENIHAEYMHKSHREHLEAVKDAPLHKRGSSLSKREELPDTSKQNDNSIYERSSSKISTSSTEANVSDKQKLEKTTKKILKPDSSNVNGICNTISKTTKQKTIDKQCFAMEEDSLCNANSRLPVTYSLMLKESPLPVEVSTISGCQGFLDDSFGHSTTIQSCVVPTDKSASWRSIDFKTLDVYTAIMNFQPMESDDESVPVKEGQQVEIIDATKPRRWLVRTLPLDADESPREGWVPACYLEKSTAEQTISNFAASEITRDPKEMEAIANREAVVRELVETEEDFSKDMQFVVENYYKRLDDTKVPKELRDRKGSIFGNFKDISDFHNNVLMKGVYYHANEPTKLGKIFLRLERDFDMHANYCWSEARAQRTLKDEQLKLFFENFSQTIGDDKTIIDHLKLPIQRLNDYQLLLKEIIKYSSRLNEDTSDLQKALDFIHSINKRTKDLQCIQSIQGCQGDLLKLGRIIKLELFDLFEDTASTSKECHVFLFKGRIIITDKAISEAENEIFHALKAFKLQDVEICENVPNDVQKILFRHAKKNRVGFPFTLRAKSPEQKETWLKDLNTNIQVTEEFGEDEPVVVQDVSPVVKKVSVSQPEAADITTKDLNKRKDESEGQQISEPQQKKTKTDDKESLVDKKEEVPKSKERKASLKRQASLKKGDADAETVDTKEEKPLQRRQSIKRQDSQSKKKKSITETESIVEAQAELPAKKSSETAVKRQKSLDKTRKSSKEDSTIAQETPKPADNTLTRQKSEDKNKSDLPKTTDSKSAKDSEKPVKRQDSVEKPKTSVSAPDKAAKVTKDKGEAQDKPEVIRSIPPVRIMSEDLSECEGRLDDLESLDTCDDNATIVSGSIRSGGSQSPPLADDAVMSDKPTFVKPLRGVTCGVGEKATLECETEGNPVPSVTWLKDNQRISKSKKITTSSKGQIHSLSIKETSPEDGGLYTVVANNTQGSASCSALLNLKLSLLGLPKEDSRPSTPGGTILPHAPVFKVKLNKETQLLDGTCVRFELVVRGNPEPTVKFFKDGKELKQDERVRVAYENKEIFELILDHVSAKDAGTYSCEATNSLGTDTTSGKLCVVKTKDVFKGLDIEEERSPTPRPRTPKFKWFKDGQDFEASERFQVIFNEEEDSLALMFQHVTPEDAGMYTCVASTSTGSKIACSAELTVQGVVREVEAPGIKTELSDVEATEGGSAMLELKITGYPKPKVTWYHKKKEVQTGGRYRFLFADEETFTLVIKNIKKDDSGAYSVKAINEIGTAESSCQLSVKSAPSFAKGLKDMSVMAEDLLAFEIEVDGNPAPDVKWYKDGQQLKPDDRITMVDAGKNKYGLKIQKAKQSDSGSYSCVLTNALGSQAEFSNVVVKASPTFVKGMENIDGLEGDSLHFTVEINGNPKPSLKWSKDGKELKVDGKHTKVIEEGVNTYSLVIENASPADVGAYTCELRNEHGLKASSGNLALKMKPEFIKKLSDMEVNQGDAGVTLSTTVKAYPAASAKWSLDGNNLSDNKNCAISSDLTSLGNNVAGYTLKLKKADCNMAGKYTCEATNEMGSTSSVGVLTVKVVNRKPEFSQSLDPTQLVEGKPGKLVAKVIGEPRPKVQWLKDGKPIRVGDHFKVEEEPDGTVSLVIDEVSSSDAGTYSIVATSDEGEAKCDAAVTTIPPGRKPEFLKELDETAVMESKPLCLLAKVTGKPTSIKWQKDGKDLSPSDNVIIKEESDGTVSLKIQAATMDDGGKYVIIASNAEGKARSVALVEVKACFKPKIDSVLKPLTLADGETGQLKLKVSGEPKPTLQWLKDGKPLKMSNRVAVNEEPDGTIALTINNARPEDAGKYTVVAENHMGSVESSAPVDVNQAPTFQKPLEPVDVVEGYPAKLEAKLSGSPPPEIKWMKDGKAITPDGEHIKEVRSPDGTVALLIDNCTPEDAANYSLVAKNSLGEKESNGSLSVAGKKAEGQPESVPSFLGPLNDVSVKEGEPIRFEAKISGNPLPDISWTLNGENVRPSDSKLITFDGKKAILDIKNSTPEDAGTYQCILSNALGKASSEGSAKVQGKAAPRFVQQLTDYTGIMGNPLILNCRVKGYPEPDIDWYFNGKPIPSSTKYSITKSGDLLCLSINSCQPEDSGIFECRAENAMGEDRTRSEVNVSDKVEKGEPPMFLKKIGDCEVMEGMTAKFTACVTGIPTPDVKWAKDGQPLELSSRHKSDLEATGILRMIIRDVDPSDFGEYSVAISNPLGSATSSAHIRPDSLDQKFISPMGDQFVGFDKFKKTGAPVPLPDKPRIIRMSDHALTLGWNPSIPNTPRTPVTYVVEMAKHPDGEYEPYKSGLKDTLCDVRGLVPGQDYKFRIRVDNKLELSEPSPYTTAHRSKFVEPIIAADYAPKDFEIEHPLLEKVAAVPRFIRREEDSMYGVRGNPVTIEFWLYGYPEPEVSWYKDDVKIGKDKYAFMQDRNGKLLVLIDKMTDDYVGTYTCHAINSEGEARMTINLLIAEHPVFTQRLDETTAMVRRCARMQCKVTGIPYPRIKWFRDWHPLYESDRVKILWEEPGTCTLFLTNLISRDAGLFSCSASNVAGTATSSATLNVEDSEDTFDRKNYNYPLTTKSRTKKPEDFYDVGEELGRGTQGVVRHVVKRDSGDSYAAKRMNGRGKFKDFMKSEMNVMNQLGHPKLVRLYDAFETPTSLDLVTDICAGGELLDNILKRGTLTEREVAHYIKQLLEGLDHMHGRFIGHLGLTVGDLLVSRVNGYDIKVGDFGLAAHLIPGKDYYLEYGHPEFVAPEIANKQPATLLSDMWSVGVVTYLLLSGLSPFLGPYDRETLTKVKEGQINFLESAFSGVTDDAKDFMSKLLVFDPSGRMNVKKALQHKWITDYAGIPKPSDKPLDNVDRLREYYKKWKEWYANASCKTCYRRRTLESCFHDPSRMIYPPGECYTPETSPERELKRPPVKPAQFDDITFQQKINREDIDFRSESHYQNGPDTYLLQLRDPDFPLRLRQYLRIGARTSPSLAANLRDAHWGDSTLVIRERRKFVDVMDEEIDDEKRGLSTRTIPMRLHHEIGTLGYAHEQMELLKKEVWKDKGSRELEIGMAPFFREKIQDIVMKEDEEIAFRCFGVGNPKPKYIWFRNDGVLLESNRIIVTELKDGRCELRIKQSRAYDVGVYKCVARNDHGFSVCRARLKLGGKPGRPDPPIVKDISDTEIYLSWSAPKDDGRSPTLCYALEYKQSVISEWTVVARNITHEYFVVRNLLPALDYQFRVQAYNKFGWGEPGFPTASVATKSEGAEKVKIPPRRKFQQELTEQSTEYEPEEIELPDYDYNIESNPIPITEGETGDFFRIVSEMDRGRFSVVLNVWVKESGTTSVAKVIQSKPGAQSDGRQEYEILKSLCHERIVQLLSASYKGDKTVLVMEKLSGVDILTYLSLKQEYNEEMIAYTIRQVLDALGYLHFRGICYIELQPDNVVMVDQRKPDIKLVDFGSSRYVSKAGGKVLVEGTLEYLPPEIVKHEEVMTGTDIWGVAVLTYILLSGVSPFQGANDQETSDNVIFVRYQFDHLPKDVTFEATKFLLQLFKACPIKRPTVAECLENKWLAPSEYMIMKRESARFLPDKLYAFAKKFHTAKSEAMDPELLTSLGLSSSKIQVKDDDF